MASPVILPKLTYEMQSGRILEWLCAEGQVLSAGQPLFVIETDKATTEVPVDEAGVLLKIVVLAGVETPVGTTLAWMGQANELAPASDSAAPALAGAAQAQVTPISAELVGPPAASGNELNPSDDITATPVAKRMARDLGIDLKAVARHAGKQRLREADVKAYVEATAHPTAASEPVPAAPAKEASATAGAAGGAGTVQSPGGDTLEYQLVLPTPLQRAMAMHLAPSALIPQSAAGCEMDLSALDAFRESLRAGWEKKFGFRLSYTHLIAALMARAIKAYPLLNATWTEEGYRLYAPVNLAVAMATERGLVVPVVRGAHERPLGEVAKEIVRLQHAAQTNRLAPQDLQGGTVTLTNVGTLGIEFPLPVLNPPHSAVLAMGTRRTKLVLENGQVRPAAVMTFTLVSDHRLVDGAVQGAFLQTFREYLENPALALTV